MYIVHSYKSMPNVITRVKIYAEPGWKRPTDKNEGNLRNIGIKSLMDNKSEEKDGNHE